MIHAEILQKAVEKAQRNGYWTGEKAYVYKNGDFINVEFRPAVDAPGVYMNYEAVIFSHDFAKAFFGEEHRLVRIQNNKLYCQTCGQQGYEGTPVLDEWQCQLQRMVLEDNPIKYLERFIEEEHAN